MKKNYIQPRVQETKLRVRTSVLTGSATIDSITPDNVGEDGDGAAKSIWNDETADGFNW